MTAILIENLTKRYGAKTAVNGVSLRIAPGEVFGFLGPNGAGKTTTIRVVMGLLRASAGSARVLGRECWRDSARIKRDVGYLPGDLRLWGWMTGRSAARIVGLARGVDLAPAASALGERFDLDMGVRVRAMSRGMRQKLGLILALAHDPRVLILDEPTASLDPIVQETLALLLRERASAGTAVFFSSHTLGEVERLCDRVAIVRDGKIVADETIAALRTRAHRVVTLFLTDTDAADRFEAPAGLLRVERREGSRLWCELLASGVELMRWAGARDDLADIEVSAPDLELLFQGFYRADNAGEGAP